ncbi:MAG: DNA-directed RNA polymerase subunit H [Vulcanisaeta sp.]|nr:DNA-directed RNA polymerase subunit H [Vulcanisaeta sp.]MCG2886539.1 DNA-directed RNA polymerase subunit H [Vulcanisaeta sp.]
MVTTRRKSKTEERLRRVLEHEYMPKAEIVPKEEVKEILKQLNAKVFQLPWIRASDPLVRAIGAKPGNVIRIIRKSDTAGVFVTYRFVVPG